jgi:hypothetical protein
MKIPGFTAGASIYKKYDHYRLTAHHSLSSDVNVIQPQQDCHAGFMSLCIPVLTTCAYKWCWWNIGWPWGHDVCTGCMDTCIDAHSWFHPQAGGLAICKLCARLWPC